MITTFWLAFGIGLASLISWILMRGLGQADVFVRFDPERRVPQLKLAIAALVGFGMAGLSSSYAGWPGAWPIVGAVAGAAGAAWYAHWVDEDPIESDANGNDVPASRL